MAVCRIYELRHTANAVYFMMCMAGSCDIIGKSGEGSLRCGGIATDNGIGHFDCDGNVWAYMVGTDKAVDPGMHKGFTHILFNARKNDMDPFAL